MVHDHRGPSSRNVHLAERGTSLGKEGMTDGRAGGGMRVLCLQRFSWIPRILPLLLACVLGAAGCADSPLELADVPDASAEANPGESSGQAYVATACSEAEISSRIDRIAMRPVARAVLKLKVYLYLKLSSDGPSPTARARLGELIADLLELAQQTTDAAQHDRIEALIDLLFCVLGEAPPQLDLSNGGAAVVTPSAGGVATMPCLADCEDGQNEAGISVPAGALPEGVSFVLVSIAPTSEALPTDLPARGPVVRVSLSPAVELTQPMTLGVCLDGTDVPEDAELLLARATDPGEPLPPGTEREGAVAVVTAAADDDAYAGLDLVCGPPPATVLGQVLKFVLPRPLYANSMPAAMARARVARAFVGPSFSFFCNVGCQWGGVIRLPRPMIGLLPTAVTLTTLVGGAAPPPSSINITNAGLESVLTGITIGAIAYSPGATGWLTATLQGTTAPTTVVLTADPAGLAEGVYTATVPIAAAQASNSPQSVTVTLRVNGIPLIALAATSASFTGVAGEPSPPPVTIGITNAGAGILTSILAGPPSYGPGASNWLQAASGSTAPTVLTLTPNITNIPPGTYTATVPVSSPLAPNSPQIVSVDLTIEAPPPSTLRFSSVSSGQGRFACGLTPEGKAYCWGPNNRGQLGDGTTVNRLRPTEVLQPAGVTFTQITAGHSHTCALTAAGQAYCWGDNVYGELGSLPALNTVPVTIPRAVQQGGITYVAIVAGGNRTCALDAAGAAYCWGHNEPVVQHGPDPGLLGVGVVPTTLETIYITTPRAVVMPPGVTFSSLTAWASLTCGLTPAGQAYCWGRNTYGQIGDGTTESRYAPTATAQPAGVTFASLNTGLFQTCGLTASGVGYCWGRNDGTFGNGESGGSNLPPTLAATTGGPWQTIESGSGFTCGVNTSGRVYCWGGVGKLGNGSAASSAIPVEVHLPAGQSFVEIATGDISACAISDSDELYCWGDNDSGSVGDGTTIDRLTPVRIE